MIYDTQNGITIGNALRPVIGLFKKPNVPNPKKAHYKYTLKLVPFVYNL
jgi:hypothetical protein